MVIKGWTILNWYKRAQTVPIKMSLYHHQQPEALAQDIMDPSFNVFTVNSDPVIWILQAMFSQPSVVQDWLFYLITVLIFISSDYRLESNAVTCTAIFRNCNQLLSSPYIICISILAVQWSLKLLGSVAQSSLPRNKSTNQLSISSDNVACKHIILSQFTAFMKWYAIVQSYKYSNQPDTKLTPIFSTTFPDSFVGIDVMNIYNIAFSWQRQKMGLVFYIKSQVSQAWFY